MQPPHARRCHGALRPAAPRRLVWCGADPWQLGGAQPPACALCPVLASCLPNLGLHLCIRPAGLAPNGVRALAAISPELHDAVARHDTRHLVQRRYTPAGELTSSVTDGSAASPVLKHGKMFSLQWHALQVSRRGGLRCLLSVPPVPCLPQRLTCTPACRPP